MAGLILALVFGAGPLEASAPEPLEPQETPAAESGPSPSAVVREMRDLRRAGQAAEALTVWEAQTEAFQEEPRILGQRAQALLDLRRVSDAWKLLKPFREQEASQPTPLRVAMVRARFGRGERRAARAGLRDLRHENPQSLDLAALAIRLCLVDRRWSEAVEQLDELDGESSHWVKGVLRVELAGALGRSALGDDELLPRSAELLAHALEQHPERGDLRALYARTLDRLGEHELAETQSALGAQLDLDSLDSAALVLARVSRFQLTGDVTAALELVDTLVAERPRHQDALATRAACLAALERIGEARAALETAFEQGVEEDHVEALLVLADVERAQGDLLAWDRALRRVLKTEPGEPRALVGLIAALEAQEQPAVRSVFVRMQARADKTLVDAFDQALAARSR